MKRLLSNPRFLLLAILIIASFLRLYNLTKLPPGLYPDEAMNGNNALEALGNHNWQVFYPENNGREGLFINIQSLFLSALGNQPWVLRLPSAIFGILTVLGIYFFTKEFFQDLPKKELGFKISQMEKMALLAAFLTATSFWHINFSRMGFRAIMAPLMLTWGVYLLMRSFRKPHWFAPIIAGVIYGLGFYTYIAYRTTPLLILVLLWLMYKKYGREPAIRIGMIFLFFTFLTALPIGAYFVLHPADFFGRTAQVSVFSSPTPLKDLGLNILKTAGMFNFSGDWNWRHNIAGQPELFWPAGILFLIGLFFGLKQLFYEKKWHSPETIIFTWLFIAAAPVVISNEGIPHALRSILMIPPIMILAAIGGIKIYELLKLTLPNRLLIAVNIVFFVLITFEAYFAYFIIWGKNPNTAGAFAENYVQIGREINSLPKNLPKYIIIEAQGTIVRGIPMPAQTVMFITDSFTLEKRKEKSIIYLLPGQENQINTGEKNYIAHIK